jgi:hypothetical protein
MRRWFPGCLLGSNLAGLGVLLFVLVSKKGDPHADAEWNPHTSDPSRKAPESPSLIRHDPGHQSCETRVAAVAAEAESLATELFEHGTLDIRFKLSEPASSERVRAFSEGVARALRKGAGDVKPHAVECRGEVCRVSVLRPPAEALESDFASPCTSKEVSDYVQFAWAERRASIEKVNPVTGEAFRDDVCFARMR